MATATSNANSTVEERANEATTAIGGCMKSLAGAIREHTPSEGVLQTASASVAESLESGGRYLQEEGLGGMANGITNLVRHHPIPTILIGVGIGLMIAKFTTSLDHGN